MREAAGEAAPAPSLTEAEQLTVARARQLAGISSLSAIREYTGHDDDAAALASAYGEAQWLLGELAAIAERLGAMAGVQLEPPEIRMLMAALTSLDYDSLTEAERSVRAEFAYKLAAARARIAEESHG